MSTEQNVVINSNKKLFGQTYYTFSINGFMTLMIGTIMPFMSKAYGLTYSFAGTLLAMHAIGNLSASFFVGAMIPLIGKKRTIITASVGIFIAFLGIILTDISFLLIICFFLTGIGRGSISNVNNSIINDIATGKSLYLNLLHTCFAIGAFLSPLIAAILMKIGFSWKFVVCVGLALTVSLIFFYCIMPLGNSQKKVVKHDTHVKPFYKNPVFYIAAGLACFYLASENSVNGWVVTYLIDTDRMTPQSSQMILSLFWLIMIVGRLTAAFISHKINKNTIILIDTIGAAIMFAIFITATNNIIIVVTIILFSFFFAGIYPTTIASVGSIIKGSSAAMAILLAVAGLGGIFMPKLIGLVAQEMGIAFGMSLLVVMVILTVVCAILLKIKNKSET